MKKVCALFLILIMIAAAAACSQRAEPAETPASSVQTDSQNTAVVTFADPVLEAMVRATMGKPEGHITVADAETVTRLNLSIEWQRYISQETLIKDIGGLEYFKNLESLDLSFHAITNITPLAGLKKLTSLSLGGNPVADIAPLAGLTNLKVLTLSGCAAQDYNPLAKLINLNFLMLDHATITDVSPLVPLTSLKHLYLADCPISNYFPLSDIYQNLEQKDFTIAFTLAELGFIMNDGKQAIYDGKSASVRINHIEWGAPPEDWMKNCVRTVFAQNGYKIDVGYYPNYDAYVMMANKDGNLVMNYVYDHAKDSFSFGMGNRESSERAVRAAFAGLDAEYVLLTPIQAFHGILTETLGVSADTLFEMPFDETDDTLPSPYERLGFTLLDYKGTCLYEEQTPHELNISIHRTEWDENAPTENRVDWSIEFNDSDVNGYKLHILYYEAEGKYHVSIEKDGVEAGIETRPVTGEKGGEYPNWDTAYRMFNDAFGTQGKEMYDKPITYFEQVVQERFSMSIDDLYALPIK
jgi:internalin A